MSNSVTLQNNGLQWSYGGSAIYDNGNLTIATDDTMIFNASTAFVFGNDYGGYGGGCVYALGNSNTQQPAYSFQVGTARSYTAGGLINPIASNGSYLPTWTNATTADNSYNSDNVGSYSLVAGQRILCCGGEIDVFSDKRIKENIYELNSNISLNIIRKLKPIKYNYKDYIKSGINDCYGFIAQDVKEQFPSSVSFYKDYIPNIYEQVEFINKNTIKLINKSKQDFFIKDTPIKIKLYILEKDKEIEKIVSIASFIDEKTFIIDQEIDLVTGFLFGQEVEDLNVLNYGSINILNISAVKQLDQELQETKNVIEIQKKQIEDQQKQIDSLQEQINSLKELIVSKLN